MSRPGHRQMRKRFAHLGWADEQPPARVDHVHCPCGVSMVVSRASVNDVRLTIVHVLTSLGVGGGERVALLLAGEQVRRGHRALVVSLEAHRGGPLGAEFEAAGVEVIRVAKQPDRFDPSLFPRLARALHRARPDVVHTHNPLPIIYAAPPAQALGARVCHTEHGRHPATQAQRVIRYAGALACHTFVGVSVSTAAYAEQIRVVPRGKPQVILNGTDVARFERDAEVRRRVRAAWGLAPACRVIGTVGRMAEVKNHALLIEAAAPLLGPDAVLVIAGDGPERAATEALIERLGIADHVRLLGEVNDVPDVLCGFDVFALSSRSEGLPMALAEAMAASLPIVATSVGGVAKVVDDGTTGLLGPSEDVARFRAMLEILLADEERALEMGRRGRAVAHTRYSLARMADEYMGAYGAA